MTRGKRWRDGAPRREPTPVSEILPSTFEAIVDRAKNPPRALIKPEQKIRDCATVVLDPATGSAMRMGESRVCGRYCALIQFDQRPDDQYRDRLMAEGWQFRDSKREKFWWREIDHEHPVEFREYHQALFLDIANQIRADRGLPSSEIGQRRSR